MDRKLKKMENALAELGFRIWVKPEDGEPAFVRVYENGVGFFTSVKYVREKGCLKFGKTEYKDMGKLVSDVREHNKRLEFNHRSYDPNGADEYRRSSRMRDVLDKFGFKTNKGRFYSCISMVSEGILGMKYAEVLDERRLVINSDAIVDLYPQRDCSDREACRAASTMLYSYYAANIAKMCELLNTSGKLGELDEIKVKKIDGNTLEIKETDMLGNVREILEKALDSLKGREGGGDVSVR